MDTNVDIRPYIETDFPLVESWWRAHHGNDFRPGFVPRAAFIVQVEGQDAGFFGVSPLSPDFAYFMMPLVNPTLPHDLRDMTVDFMVDAAKLWTANAGIAILYISISGEKFLNRLRAKGFVTGETGNTHMFATVGEIK